MSFRGKKYERTKMVMGPHGRRRANFRRRERPGSAADGWQATYWNNTTLSGLHVL
jgi:hypothetical protein